MVNTAPKAGTVQRGSRANSPRSSTPPRIIAVKIRSLSIGFRGDLRRGFAEPALPLREELERRLEVRGGKFRPQHVREVELGVGEIPQKKVAHPPLPAGADEKVGIRQAGEREPRSQPRLRDVRRCKRARGDV